MKSGLFQTAVDPLVSGETVTHMFRDENFFHLNLLIQALSYELIGIALVDRDRNLQIPKSGTDFRELSEIGAQHRDIPGSVVRSLTQEIQNQVLDHLDLRPVM